MNTTFFTCKSVDCNNTVLSGNDLCPVCIERYKKLSAIAPEPIKKNSELYPAYFKDVSHLTEVDVYQICSLFGIQDSSGAIHHAIKKLLLSGKRTGKKSLKDDIREARDTLNRFLEMEA